MKKLIFGGICFLGGLLMFLVIPSVRPFTVQHILEWIAVILIFFGFILSVIGFVKKDG